MISVFNADACAWMRDRFGCIVCVFMVANENHFLKIPPSKMSFRIEDSETSKLTKQALVKNNDGNAKSMSHTQRACEVQLSARLVLVCCCFIIFSASSFVLRLFIHIHICLCLCIFIHIHFSWACQFESIGMRFKSVNACVWVWAINAKYDLLGVRHKH